MENSTFKSGEKYSYKHMFRLTSFEDVEKEREKRREREKERERKRERISYDI